ncbi:ABC transporter ATP-binding protein [Aneurinibacillus thermoaerophilus]|uniref:ABC transporter ATP-binding protein n=2 Tax=Aneurinibacillus thermoaerophilus TaxID=143495 RepID=UPI002E1CDBF1|nr:ABC transporter ATP-binding protein [Aneurinibacillus thermoaerophilus]
MTAIKVQNVSKIYKLYDKPVDRLKESIHPFGKKYHKDFYALKDISFEIKRGETIGIIGKNGSGKSTLLKMITGVLTPSAGMIEANGKISALLELGAGFNLELTGIENIYLNGTLMGFSREDVDKKLNDILSFADIGDFIYQPVKLYSSGMFARLAFSVAINVEPDILIVDEALAVGDVKFQTKCFNKFTSLKEKGVTILFVSHDISSIRNFCDKTMWIHEGHLKEIGDTVEVTAEYMEFMNSTQLEKGYEENEQESVYLKQSNFQPINRWGSNVGLIRYAEIYNQKGKITDVFETFEKIKLDIVFYIPEEIDFENLSVAFSIKNVTGIDLVVSTTFDSERIRFNRNGCYAEVSFEFENYLNVGEYILVVALEDRSQIVPEYYDYIEGAKYFKVVSNKKLFGMFNIPVNQTLIYVEEKQDEAN